MFTKSNTYASISYHGDFRISNVNLGLILSIDDIVIGSEKRISGSN